MAKLFNLIGFPRTIQLQQYTNNSRVHSFVTHTLFRKFHPENLYKDYSSVQAVDNLETNINRILFASHSGFSCANSSNHVTLPPSLKMEQFTWEETQFSYRVNIECRSLFARFILGNLQLKKSSMKSAE